MIEAAHEIVELARSKDRLTALDYFEHVFSDFQEFHGDRLYADDEAVVGGVAALDGKPVTVIGIQKGRNLPENLRRNFGAPHPEGYRKALRLMKQAEKFQRPVITLINTAGAYCGVGAEERGEGEAIARNLLEMSDLKVPILAIIIGEGDFIPGRLCIDPLERWKPCERSCRTHENNSARVAQAWSDRKSDSRDHRR